MSNSQLLIPPRIRVGAQKRVDTYTGQLGYVIYYDTKGKLCKEKSWESWRDKSIEPMEYPNAPTEGFVINKSGGGHGGHSWNERQAFVRVWDPRNFEFEIAVDNLVFILCQGGCTPGKGLEGKFVYAWRGGRLVLLPCHSEEYTSSVEFTDLRDKSVAQKSLVMGATYITKTQDLLVYLGRYQPLELDIGYGKKGRWEKCKGPPHVFVVTNNEAEPYMYLPDTRELAECRSAEPVSNLAELTAQFLSSHEVSPIAKIEIVDSGHMVEKQAPWNNGWPTHDTSFFVEEGSKIRSYTLGTYGYGGYTYTLQNGRIVADSTAHSNERYLPKQDIEKYGRQRLRVTLASGEQYWYIVNPRYGTPKFQRTLPRLENK